MYGIISNFTKAYKLEEVYNEIEFKRDTITVGGVEVVESRLTKWMSDKNYTFKYGGKIMKPDKIPNIVKEIQNLIHTKYGVYFDSVLANYYENGNIGMRFHSDPTYEFWDEHSVVISIGDSREITFRNKNNFSERKKFKVNNRDLMFMKEGCQSKYQHRVNKNKKAESRISLVFKKKKLT